MSNQPMPAKTRLSLLAFVMIIRLLRHLVANWEVNPESMALCAEADTLKERIMHEVAKG